MPDTAVFREAVGGVAKQGTAWTAIVSAMFGPSHETNGVVAEDKSKDENSGRCKTNRKRLSDEHPCDEPHSAIKRLDSGLLVDKAQRVVAARHRVQQGIPVSSLQELYDREEISPTRKKKISGLT